MSFWSMFSQSASPTVLDATLCAKVVGAMTVLMEAEGESYEGKLAVAFTIVNRPGDDVSDVFKPWQYSCWNTDSPTRKRIGGLISSNSPAWQDSVRAVEAAFSKSVPDPTHGATHYLNEKYLRSIGKLPAWFNEDKVTARIGNHTFLANV